ncbi:hypothetical protein M758_3G033600 [Ceratodon purpureus]|uniref:Secreted protein n=1 Tax=Ceratodon purpureus TaxID=3225 RepID=A0A8T0IGU8_CERPU|nr:hypothetical protein KC19_3G034600 [Ceratodon purpureus]KAG0621600.1 hypothetical protein M758_3G033600 [Ceratodon purpureus]
MTLTVVFLVATSAVQIDGASWSSVEGLVMQLDILVTSWLIFSDHLISCGWSDMWALVVLFCQEVL